MKMNMNEKLHNFPDDIQPIATAVEGQALEDEEEFDKRWEDVDKELRKGIKLPIDGAPKQPKPEAPKEPKIAKLDEALFSEDNNGIEARVSNYLQDAIENVVFHMEKYIKDYNPAWKDEEYANFDAAEMQFVRAAIQYLFKNLKKNEGLSIVENINEDDAARVVREVILHKYGVDVDVATYKDTDNSKCVIVQFIASKEDCEKMPYDDLKEELYKRFNNEINISCKQFSSPNLKQKGTEYKLKLFVLKEKKDKSKIYAEDLNDDVSSDNNINKDNDNADMPDTKVKKKKKDYRKDPHAFKEGNELLMYSGQKLYRIDQSTGDRKQIGADYHGRKFNPNDKDANKLSLWSRVYNELSKQSHNVTGGESYNLIAIPEGQRYCDTVGKTDFELDDNDIIIHMDSEDKLDNAKRVAEFYNLPYEMRSNPNARNENFKYSIRIKFTDDQLPTEDEEERFGYDYDNDENFAGMLDEPDTSKFRQSESSLVHDSYTNDDLYDEDDYEDDDEFYDDTEIDDSEFDPDAEEELEKEEAKADELKKKSKNESLQTKLNFKNDLKAFNRVMERFYDVMNK